MKSLSIKPQSSMGTILAALLCLFSLNTIKAQELNFDFTLMGDPSIDDPSTSYLSGTVSGEIIGLENNASSVPSDIIITSAPSGLNLTSSLPYSFEANGWNLSEFGTITVTNGTIASANMYQASLANQNDFFYLNVGLSDEPPNPGVFNGIDFDNKSVANLDGFSGVTYSLAPEPSTSALLLGGLGMVAFWRLRTRAATRLS